MATNTGIIVRIDGLFSNNDAVEYTGISDVTFDAGFWNMTLTPSACSSSISATTVVGITGCRTITLLRSTLAYPGNTTDTPSA